MRMVIKVWSRDTAPPDFHEKKFICTDPGSSDHFYDFWVFQPVMHFFIDEGVMSCDLIAYSEEAVDSDVPEKHLEIEVREVELMTTPKRTRFN